MVVQPERLSLFPDVIKMVIIYHCNALLEINNVGASMKKAKRKKELVHEELLNVNIKVC